MFKPEVYAKSSLGTQQLECKTQIGGDGIEVQLLSELVNGRIGSYHRAVDIFDLDNLLKYNIKAVHAPILSMYGLSDVNVETLCDSQDFMLLDQVCYIANKAGEMHNRQIIVVIHSEQDRDNMMLMGDTWKRVMNCLGCLLLKYPHIEIGIENITPLRTPCDKKFHLSNNFYLDNLEMVKELRKQLNTDRIGTVVDTCHVEITASIYKILKQHLEDVIPTLDITIDNIFKENAPYVKLFHFSDTIGHGYGKGKHGVPFTDTNKQNLFNYLDTYHKYNITAPITLEVAEEDFLTSEGYRTSLAKFNEYYANKA